MKNVLLAAAAFILLTATSCGKQRLRGSGDSGSETRAVSNFTSVEADGSTPVEVYPSTEDKVVVTGYKNLIGVYETNVSGGTLKLKFKDDYINIRNSNLQIAVYTKDMNRVRINCSGNVQLHSGFTTSAMVAEINGSGDVNFDKNSFNNVRAEVNGSGNISGQACTAQNLSAKISGSGNIRMTVEKMMSVQISGSGNIHYWGSPVITDINISGSGNIQKH